MAAPPFSATLSGRLTQTTGRSGLVTVTITATVSGGTNGVLEVVLEGRPVGGGVSLDRSTVTLGPAKAPAIYWGYVVSLNGEQLVAAVSSGHGAVLDLGLTLHIDPATGGVSGTLQARAGA